MDSRLQEKSEDTMIEQIHHTATNSSTLQPVSTGKQQNPAHAQAIIDAAEAAGMGLVILGTVKGADGTDSDAPVLLYVNHAAEAIGGYPVEQATGEGVSRFI